MLHLAKRQLRVLIDALRPHLRIGVPIVVLEPSCASVFRDELRNLYPDDADARRLAQLTMTFAEFVDAHEFRFRHLRLNQHALLHRHCHQKSIMNTGADDRVLSRLGVEVETPDSGCCGMAGAFGFTKGDPNQVSIKCGERVLLPAVRKADGDTLLVADGFSCREQISQGTGRQALHLAQVLALARP